MPDLHLVSTEASASFARRLADRLGVAVSGVERRHFPDGESYLRFEIEDAFELLGRDVVVVGSSHTHEALDELYRLAFTATQSGARSVVMVVPYFGYSTMERAVRPGEQVAAKSIARLLSGLPPAPRGTWVLVMDIHSPGLVHYFEGSTVALEVSGTPRIVEAIRRMKLHAPVMASTDMGRAKQVERYANLLSWPVALVHKKRLGPSRTEVSGVLGDVEGRDVVIYDDMIRTGSSLVTAAQAYKAAGARSVHAVTTHLVLPPGTLARLEAAPLDTITGTDTHPNHSQVEGRPRYEVVSVADLFADVVRRLTST